MSSPQESLDKNMKDFVRACVNGKFDEVKAMIETSDGNNRRKLFLLRDADYGRNALHWAVYHCDIEAIKYLITYGEVGIRTMDKTAESVFIRALNPGPAVPIIRINDYPIRSPKPTMEMLKILLEADERLITFYVQTDPLSIAIECQSIEVIEFLIQRNADVNSLGPYSFGWNALHKAAHCKRIDVIRFLLEKTACDRLLKDSCGYVPCCVYMRSVAYSSVITIVTKEMIDFCIEFMSLTFKSPNKFYEVHLLLFQCIGRKNVLNENANISMVCQRIAEYLITNSLDKCLVDLVKQLCDAQDEKYLTLISLLMYENLLCHFDDDEEGSQCYNTVIQSVDTLLEELFNLFLVNEQLTNEFVKRIAKTKFAYYVGKQLRESMPWDRKQVPLQTIYNFAKMLLRNGVDVFEKCERIYTRNEKRWEYLLQAIVPLCSYVRVPLELAFHIDHARSVRNFNESEYWMKDYRICKKEEELTQGVVSLKNLARTTIREHLFQNGNVCEKISALHSMEFPLQLINFICYNDYNLKL